MVNDYLGVIRLGFGKGKPGHEACWMTALGAHINYGEWTDRLDCVDPIINSLCIAFNDSFGQDDEARTKAIMDFGFFVPLGTSGDIIETLKRTNLVLEEIFYKVANPLMRMYGFHFPILTPTQNTFEIASELKKARYAVLSMRVTQSTKDLFEYCQHYFAAHALFLESEINKDGSIRFPTSILNNAHFIREVHCLMLILSHVELVLGTDKQSFIKELLNKVLSFGPKAPEEPSIDELQIKQFLREVGYESV